MASQGNQHCANCIGALSFPTSTATIIESARVLVFWYLFTSPLDDEASTRGTRVTFVNILIKLYTFSTFFSVCVREIGASASCPLVSTAGILVVVRRAPALTWSIAAASVPAVLRRL